MDSENDNPKISGKDAGGYLLFYLGILNLNEKWKEKMIIQEISVKDAGGHLLFLPWHFALRWKTDKENDNPKISVEDAGGNLLFYRGKSFLAF